MLGWLSIMQCFAVDLKLNPAGSKRSYVVEGGSFVVAWYMGTSILYYNAKPIMGTIA